MLAEEVSLPEPLKMRSIPRGLGLGFGGPLLKRFICIQVYVYYYTFL